MRNYLQPQTTGDVLRNTFAIYGKGFWAILLTFLLPVFPFQVWQAEAKAANNTPLYFLAFVAGIVGGLFAFGAIAITVSDICLGNKPGVTRSYKRVFSTIPGKLLVTNFLNIICWGLPAVPLYVLPAHFSKATDAAKMIMVLVMIASLIVSVMVCLRFLFASSIVVLEGRWGFHALKRSKALASGFNWRTLAVLTLLWIIVLLVLTVAAVVLIVLHVKSPVTERIFASAIATTVMPIFFIAAVLLYYDSRVRKEAYDNAALAEDLRR